jgi:hypothetical protein
MLEILCIGLHEMSALVNGTPPLGIIRSRASYAASRVVFCCLLEIVHLCRRQFCHAAKPENAVPVLVEKGSVYGVE